MPVAAQTTPLGLPMFTEPPELTGAPVTVRPSGILKNTTKDCVQEVEGSGWVCLATLPEVATSKSEAVAQANAAVAAEASARATADTALGARIDTVQASIPTPDTVCGTAAITGLSIPLTGISSATTLTVTGATAGSPCVVGGSSFLPLGAYAVCAVTAANTVQVRFQGGGLLGSIISIPSGTYKACALVRP
jgi:hypothetical protein